MKLLYITSKRYPSSTADHFFIKNMARAFTQILRDDFILYISGEVPEELKNINVFSVNAPKRLRSLFYFIWIPFFIIKNKFYLKKNVFFSNDPNLLIILIFWKNTLFLKYKICSDWHQLFNDWRDKYISTNSDLLISTSEKLKTTIVEKFGVNKSNILVAYGGVDVSYFEKSFNKRLELGLPEDKILVGYVGFYKTMGMEKGIATMIKSLKFVEDKNIMMVFVGNRQNEKDEYLSLAKNLGVQDRCIFIDAVPPKLVPVYEKSIDILCIPYPDEPHFSDWGFPMKVYEYMASSRPIIYSDLEIMREVLGDCALAFKPNDPNDLVKKITMILKDQALTKQMVWSAFQKVQNYTWKKRVENILARMPRA